MRKLEENFKQSGGKWAEFRIGDLFEKIKTKKLKFKAQDLKNKQDEIYNLPALTAGIENQGLAYYVPRENATILKNVISVSANGANTGVMFYQPNDFTVLQDSYAIKFRYKELSNLQYLFFVAALQKSIRFQFDWSNKAGWEKIKNRFISLPVLPSCNENKFEIAFEYMESYIKELEAERLEELEAYLLTTGLKDYKLTEQEKVILQDFAKLQDENSKRGEAFSSLEDYLLYGSSLLDSKKQNFITHALSCLTQRALKSLDTSKWQEFRIGDLFDVVSLKKLNPLDSREFRVKETDKKHPIPAIVAKVGNNGVMYYVGKNDYETAQNKIVIIGDGAVASGLVYYHEKEFTILHNAYAIELKQKEFAKKENYLFLATAIQKSIFEVFNYELKPTWNKVKQECISLPVLPLDSIKEDSRNYTHHIDFAFMESFIKEIQKEHFLSLIEYYHKLVSAYNEVLETNGGGH